MLKNNVGSMIVRSVDILIISHPKVNQNNEVFRDERLCTIMYLVEWTGHTVCM